MAAADYTCRLYSCANSRLPLSHFWNSTAEWCPNHGDRPPLKWSDLRYVFDIKEDCNGKEAIQA
jgi:hypothetical protein